MPIFCAKIFLDEFLSNIKVPEFEHELEPGDLGWNTYKQMSRGRTFSPRHFADTVL